MRLDACDDDLRAARRRQRIEQARRSGAAHGDLLDHLRPGRQVCGHLGRGVSEPLRVLLGDQHRHAEQAATSQQLRRALHDGVPAVQHAAVGLLQVDQQRYRALAMEEGGVTHRASLLAGGRSLVQALAGGAWLALQRPRPPAREGEMRKTARGLGAVAIVALAVGRVAFCQPAPNQERSGTAHALATAGAVAANTLPVVPTYVEPRCLLPYPLCKFTFAILGVAG